MRVTAYILHSLYWGWAVEIWAGYIHKLASMSEDRRVFTQVWDAKPCRGSQRKVWSRLVIWYIGCRVSGGYRERGKALVEESIGERESRKFMEHYKPFGKEVQFKEYLHGMSDAGPRLFFNSGTHGFNEELGRHRGREGRKVCMLCGDECEC